MANEAIDRHEHLIKGGEPFLAQESKTLKGKLHREELTKNLLTFEPPWRNPFRRMLVHPKLIDIFNNILDPDFRMDHGPGLN